MIITDIIVEGGRKGYFIVERVIIFNECEGGSEGTAF